jgi:hypothetical protein
MVASATEYFKNFLRRRQFSLAFPAGWRPANFETQRKSRPDGAACCSKLALVEYTPMQNSLGAVFCWRDCATIHHLQNTSAGLPSPVQANPYSSPRDAPAPASAGSAGEAPTPPVVAHHDDGSILGPLVASPSGRGAGLSSMRAPDACVEMSRLTAVLPPRAYDSSHIQVVAFLSFKPWFIAHLRSLQAAQTLHYPRALSHHQWSVSA